MALILHLPDQPIWGEDASYAQLFGWIFSIAVTNGIHQGLMQSQLDALAGENTTHRLNEQLQQRGQLQRGRKRELCPAKPGGRHSRAR